MRKLLGMVLGLCGAQWAVFNMLTICSVTSYLLSAACILVGLFLYLYDEL
jgi:hypothetical protein